MNLLLQIILWGGIICLAGKIILWVLGWAEKGLDALSRFFGWLASLTLKGWIFLLLGTVAAIALVAYLMKVF